MKDFIWENVGAWLGFCVLLTFVVPPVGLFLLAVLFTFVYPLLVLLVIGGWIVGGIAHLIPSRG